MESNYKFIQAEDPIQSGLLGDFLQISKKVMLEPERQGGWVLGPKPKTFKSIPRTHRAKKRTYR